MRRFAIGDIHGCSKALRTLIESIDPQPDDELVFLGDYIDRGPDSPDVIDQIMRLSERTGVIALRGNHEIMLQSVVDHGADETMWLANGGQSTVTSYGGTLSKIPASHLEFFRRLVPYYETLDSIFVHAGYLPNLDLNQHEASTLFWDHLPKPLPGPHRSGKRVFVGHTPQFGGNVLNAGHVICIDTFCFGGGYLTAYDVTSDEVVQVDQHGFLRRLPPLVVLARAIRRWIRPPRARTPDRISISSSDHPTGDDHAKLTDSASQPCPSDPTS